MMNNQKIHILGAEYLITYVEPAKEPRLSDCYGITDPTSKTIKIDSTDYAEIGDNNAHRKAILRHEIIHAFLYESGMDGNSHKTDSWAIDEEIVDWLAIVGPKIFKVWALLSIL